MAPPSIISLQTRRRHPAAWEACSNAAKAMNIHMDFGIY